MGIDLIEIGMEVGEKLKIDDEKLFRDHVETVQDICHAANRALEEQHHSDQTDIPSKEEIRAIVFEAAAKVTGTSIEDISIHTRFRDICD